ncbi:MAG: hypothetical protein ABIN67_04495 [Ferruginibacter sp.]
MKRITTSVLPLPTDNTPIPAPKLVFGTQKAKPGFPTGGLFSFGSIKFNLNNIPMVELAKQAFAENSMHKDTPGALEAFLLCLSITSAFEAGFDGINTYDNAGVSVGFIQLARPEGGVGKLLELTGKLDLSARIKTAFGTIDPHNSPAALKGRFNTALLKELVLATSGPEGIKAQFAMAINKNIANQNYFDKAYSKFIELQLKDDLSAAMLFDAAVNMGAGSVSRFPRFTQGNDGDWISASIRVFSRPERREGWKKILSKNFA